MNSGTQDQAEGTFLKIKSKVKEVAEQPSDNPSLEAEGTEEKIPVQEKIGQDKTVLGT